MASIIPPNQPSLLMSEIERQIIIASNSSQHTRFGSNHGIGELTIKGEDHINYLDLRDWCRILIYLGHNDKAKWEDIAIPPNAQKCVWKLLAFSTSSPIIDQECQQGRCRDIQDIRRRDGLDGSYTDDIWQAASFRSWATSTVSSIVIIQGNSQTTRRLERFSYELSRQLRDIHPTIWMLSEPSSREFFARHDETEILRQLAIQALQKVSHFKASFLIHTLRLFKQCITSYDWFHVLKAIFQLIPKVYVILDLSILGRRINHAKNWSQNFQTLISELSKSCSSRLAVMLLSNRPLPRGDPNAPIVSVDSQSQRPAQLQYRETLAKSSQNNSVKCLATLIPKDEDTSGQKAHNSIQAPEMERRTSDPTPGASARYDSTHNASASETSRFYRQGNDATPINTSNRILNSTAPSIPPQNKIAIAIICALTLEADAVLASFDHHWDIQSFRNLDGDRNTYSVGRIGCHNVVLVHMPDVGRTQSATVAARCRVSFPGITLALVVGICGAVPLYGSKEILLGDVIISDRLVIYDFGRQFPDTFVRKEKTPESARKPPWEIRCFLSKIKGKRSESILHTRTGVHLQALLRNDYTLYPGVEEDRLFDPSYRHKHQAPTECAQCSSSEALTGQVCDISRASTCDTLGCDPGKLIVRQRHSRITNSVGNWLPAIRFGAYASGDKVMKSGEHRDEIAKREDVIAFEMEGAGAWEIFPCIIIKGVCDYADSHKNKKWQEYAAATAAACMKGLLEVWPSSDSTANAALNS
ncbi:hypothetical protein GGR51DRAFT_541433 [Nemania sp. FL0031]|nr:hypothetical protein GGR51DRAFT_541433 [Nemania sp. FL0031]